MILQNLSLCCLWGETSIRLFFVSSYDSQFLLVFSFFFVRIASGEHGKTQITPCFFSFRSMQVSWIRKRDLHILTVGILTYTNDQRFQALHQEGSDEWTLKISSPQPRDSGTYECQVSMEPKISLAFRLSVIGESKISFFFQYRPVRS